MKLTPSCVLVLEIMVFIYESVAGMARASGAAFVCDWRAW